MDLLGTWKEWAPSSRRLILKQDEKPLLQKPDQSVVIHGWKEYVKHPKFSARKDKSFHLALIPKPFVGNLQNASIYILLLNPGLSPTDYYGEFEVKGFRSVLLNSLKQKWSGNQMPFLFLDPKYSWHEGFGWWNEKLLGVMEELAKHWNVELSESRKRLATQLAAIEMIPYHSKSFGGHNLLSKLESTKLVRSFVNDYVIPKVKKGKAIVIVTRKTREWNIQERHKGIIQYDAQEARSAHLTPGSKGGKAIISHLKKLV